MLDARLRKRGEGNAAELGEHDRLASMRVAVEREDTPPGPPPVEQLLGLDLRTIALPQMLDIGIVIMNADNVGGAAFPAVVADDGAGGVERFCQVIQRLDSVPLLAHRSEIGYAPGFVERNPNDDAGMA